MDEMDEYRERIERQYGPDRRAPKIEPRPDPLLTAITWYVVGLVMGTAFVLVWSHV